MTPATAAARVPRLHVLTPTTDPQRALVVVDAALAAGARCIQVRAKDRSDRDHLAFTAQVVDRCRALDAVCLINDRVDIAIATGADGVHLGADDLPVATVRAMVDAGFLIGGTAREPETARRLVSEGADYLGVGPVYATSTKDGLPEPIGVDTLRAVVAAVEVPVIAIAGITAERLPQVVATGAHGAAVIGAVADADDPRAATRELLDGLQGSLEDGPEDTP